MQRHLLRLRAWAYGHDTFVRRSRVRRMTTMLRLVRPPPKARIVDLGGTEDLWRSFRHDFNITLVNLPEARLSVTGTPRFTIVEADACDLRGIIEDKAFDVAFSNSTIEHVGDERCQAYFAGEVRRIASAYWVQTPGGYFPIEAHTTVPYFWQLPKSIRKKLYSNWQRRFPAWTDMIKETRVLSRPRMIEFFPDGRQYIERWFGFEKSYVLYRPYVRS